jgi:hypothetical protein
VTPALGTPSSGTLTNCTGLPVSTGISGLGSGVATFLATPSSANLAAAVTGETGSGALVFGTGPSIAGATLTGAIDGGGADSFELPNSAAPTVNADGEIAVDTSVSDFSHGVIKYYSGEELGVVAMPIAEFTSPTNGAVPTYNSTTDEFEMAVPSGSGGREVLSADRTYYVRADGSDSNDGLSNSSGGAFLTIQKAIDTAVGVDLSTFAITIQVGAGTYTGANTLKSYIGVGPITIQGDTSTPSNVVISTTSAVCVTGNGVTGKYVIKGVKFQTTTSGNCITLDNQTILDIESVDFGTTASGFSHISVGAHANLTVTGNYSITGNAQDHWLARTIGLITCSGRTITLTGTPAFTTFARALRGAGITTTGNTFSGAATGTRYSVTMNAWVESLGATLPGNAAGSTATGGQYS